MGDYNPRQITQMRWKDAKELEKYLFLTGNFNLETKLLEHVSNDKLYKRIYEELALCSKNQTRKGVIIEDTGFGGCYIGEIADDNTMQLKNFYGNQTDIVDINIANDDELQITKETKTFLTAADAPKMYRYNLKISHKRTAYDDNQHDIFLTYYSSNNLEANTLENLTTLTKAVNGTNLRAPVYSITNAGSSDYDKISLYYMGAIYNGGAWNIMNTNGTSSGIAINSVTDTVEPA